MGRRGCLGWGVSFVLVGATANAQSTFTGMTPVAGDQHQHGGNIDSAYELRRAQAGAPDGRCPHEFGRPLDLFDHADNVAGFDWLLLSHHGMNSNPDSPAYEWWTVPGAQPVLKNGQPFITPDPAGLKDYLTNGIVSPPWDEAQSLSSLAAFKTSTSSDFVAMQGREYTTVTEVDFPAPFNGGHKIMVLVGPPDRACSRVGVGPHSCDETALYRLIHQNMGVLIQAHPANWKTYLARWDPVTVPAGLNDLFVNGVEIGNRTGLAWEDEYQLALGSGHRLFPSFGGDRHKEQLAADFGVACTDAVHEAPTMAEGAAMCWVPTGGMSATAIRDAMWARRCYYARSYKPRLEYELRGSPTAPVRMMGSVVNVGDNEALVRVVAVNDITNHALGRRLDRLEVVHVGPPDANGEPTATVVYSCTDCCTNGDSVNPDVCSVEFESMNVPNGAIYPRVCSDPAGDTPCVTNHKQRTVLVGAPIFVNWSAYRSANGWPANDNYDVDSDGVPLTFDNCWTDANAGQEDADGDGVGDACDLCPSAYDPLNMDTDGVPPGDACNGPDSDGDGWANTQDFCPNHYSSNNPNSDQDAFGNACDNCDFATNPDQADSDGDGAGDACDTCPLIPDPEQIFDSDGDNRGDPCDNCVTVANADQKDFDTDGIGDACDDDDDGDGVSDTVDNCIGIPNPDQADTWPVAPDGVGDACDADQDGIPIAGGIPIPLEDNCPSVSDSTAQGLADSEEGGDGVGRACDNCRSRSNPRVPEPQFLPAYRTTTGGQYDDDGDGYGNECDLDVVAPSPAVDDLDLAEIDATFGLSEYPSPSASACGTTGTLNCDLFDFVGSHDVLDFFDEIRGSTVPRPAPPGILPGPKCAACGVNFLLLPCVGDACIECNDGIDNDADGFIDWQGGVGGDPNCTSNEDDFERENNTPGCGMGPELVALLLGLKKLRRTRRLAS